MNEVVVSAGQVRYPVCIGDFSKKDFIETFGEHSGLFVFADKNVWSIYCQQFADFGQVNVRPPGEETKDASHWKDCLSWLAQSGADRNSIVVAIGGGVICDLAGFVAASYMRGIRWSAIATSLLAQIDAAIGGKTAIDLPEGKNLAGAFHHPISVWCDAKHLNTLPTEHYRNGMAEAIKYGLILDADFLAWQKSSTENLKEKDHGALEKLIFRCCELKAAIVSEDPNERSGRRAVLNFGHTVGHAIEQAMNYRGILHGEAVMIGMLAEAEIGEQIGFTEKGARKAIQDFANAWELPTTIPGAANIDKIMIAMQKDKKNQSGKLSMALLVRPGACRLVHDVDAETVRRVLIEL